MEDLEVAGDREALRTIVQNLLTNAVDYNHDGGRVRVTLESDAAQAHLQVEDTGIGIRAEDRARIFERFFRVNSSRSRERGGNGLGLAIVKQLVAQLAGEIWSTRARRAGACSG